MTDTTPAGTAMSQLGKIAKAICTQLGDPADMVRRCEDCSMENSEHCQWEEYIPAAQAALSAIDEGWTDVLPDFDIATYIEVAYINSMIPAGTPIVLECKGKYMVITPPTTQEGK